MANSRGANTAAATPPARTGRRSSNGRIATSNRPPPTNFERSGIPRPPDTIDEHYYRSTDQFIRMSPEYARKYDRAGPEIFVGEWAAHEDGKIKPWSAGARKQPPTPSMKAAIGDGVFMARMEPNSDT